MTEYAKLHGVTVGNICRRLGKRQFKSAVRINGRWKLDPNEIPAGGFRAHYRTEEERKRGKAEANQKWLAENREKARASCRNYFRENRQKVKRSNRRNYLKRKYANVSDEDLVSVSEYSKIHRLSGASIRGRILRGTAYSAKKVNGRWMLSRKEIFDGTPRRVTRTCLQCGKTFLGFSNSLYCEDCRGSRDRKNAGNTEGRPV